MDVPIEERLLDSCEPDQHEWIEIAEMNSARFIVYVCKKCRQWREKNELTGEYVIREIKTVNPSGLRLGKKI